MNCMTYNHRNIIKITTKELLYKDNNDQIKSIDFYECRKNWVKYINESNDDLTEEKTSCVGWRDILGKPPYIELFSDPRIKFTFNERRTLYEWLNNKNSSKGNKNFIKLHYEINEKGWKTFDLS